MHEDGNVPLSVMFLENAVILIKCQTPAWEW